MEESLRVTPSLRISLAAFLQLVLAIRPSGVEQAIAAGSVFGSCDHQGLVKKTRQAVISLAEAD